MAQASNNPACGLLYARICRTNGAVHTLHERVATLHGTHSMSVLPHTCGAFCVQKASKESILLPAHARSLKKQHIAVHTGSSDSGSVSCVHAACQGVQQPAEACMPCMLCCVMLRLRHAVALCTADMPPGSTQMEGEERGLTLAVGCNSTKPQNENTTHSAAIELRTETHMLGGSGS